MIRHVAICAAAVAAYVLRSELEIGYTALSIVALGAVLNFLAYAFRGRPELARACTFASPIIGIGSWTALIAVTKGVASPFVAGLWLEVVLSAMTLRREGVVLVTLGAVAALWVQQLWLGIESAGTALLLETGFLVGMGGATFLVTRRWIRTQTNLSRRYAELAERLAQLEIELDDERALGELGEGVGRLAHGLKNAVHGVRGFAGLIEPRLSGTDSDQAALAGLRGAIDNLEELARLTLDPRGGAETSVEGARACSPAASLERALQEICRSHPGVDWSTSSDGTSPELMVSDAELREVLLVLLSNAAEAMNGHGKARIDMRSAGCEFRVAVSDEGEGLAPGARSRIFEAGYTTKARGSGYGLFLARRLVEKHGGRLGLLRAADTGTAFEIALPVAADARALAATAPTR